MARKKRADAQAVLSAESSNAFALSNLDTCAENRETCYSTYSTALYARLSVEDSGKEDGYSLENQISLLKGYIKSKEEFSLYNVYIDNGESGVRFDRPSFNQMIADMRAGKINCIIVKDLSRLGRNYLEAGNYMEKIFPFFHVRFISVMDDYDSLNGSTMDDGITIPLKNIINESYSKDISRKISATLDTRRKKGEYIYKYPPYGYLYDPEKEGHLIIDHEVADNVRMIFTWRSEGLSPRIICEKLNAAQIPSPYKYLYLKGITKSESYINRIWTREFVDHLLRKPVYIGNVVTGRERTSIAEGVNRKKMPEAQWFVTEGTHEPIVSKELFYKVQSMIETAAKRYKDYCGSYKDFEVENLYRGRMRCGRCGAAMRMMKLQRKTQKYGLRNTVLYDCCRRERRVSPECSVTTINKETLDAIVLEEIQSFIRRFVDAEEVIRQVNTEPKALKKCQEFNDTIWKKRSRINKLHNLCTDLYEDLKDGLLEEGEYLQMKANYAKEKQSLEQQIAELEKNQKLYMPDYSVSEKVHNVIHQSLNTKELSADLVNTFVDKITVFDKNHIQIKYTFQEEMDSLMLACHSREGGE